MSISVLTGASSGIGRATALAIARPGDTLHLIGRERARLEVLAAELRVKGANAILHELDLSRDGRLGLAGPIDVLVHAAGIVKLGAVGVASLEDLDLQYRVNTRAPYALTQELLEGLVAAKGQVVFINSGAGRNAKASWSQYAMTKFALRALADSLREELKPKGVRVISIYPGRTATPMQAEVHAQERKAYDPTRFIQPEDVATMIAQSLALPRTAQLTEIDIRHQE